MNFEISQSFLRIHLNLQIPVVRIVGLLTRICVYSLMSELIWTIKTSIPIGEAEIARFQLPVAFQIAHFAGACNNNVGNNIYQQKLWLANSSLPVYAAVRWAGDFAIVAWCHFGICFAFEC